VDLLTDEQIANTCLTVEQCAFPPLLTVVRRVADRSLWRPPASAFDKRLPMYSVNGDDPQVPGNAKSANHNFQLLKLLPPFGNELKVHDDVSGLSQSFYPRGATVETAKIVRMTFTFRGERLYAYLDLTCGAARAFSRRNGFMGQNNARPNGIFHELMYVPSGSMPNTHGPMRGDLGITRDTRVYGPGAARFSLDPKFAFQGPSDGRKLKWATWWQSWMQLTKLSPAMMVAAYLKTALEWAFMLPPRGNMPVTILYFYAAQVEYRKLRPGTAVDFSAVELFSGRFYREMKEALDWLVAPDNSGNGRPNFMSQSLVGSQCMRDLPGEFTRPFLNGIKPPELGCSSAVMNCAAWCSFSCKPFWSVIQQARKLSWGATMVEVPKCSRCPGLLGIFRDQVPARNELSKHSV
jgi:hypothetical protein